MTRPATSAGTVFTRARAIGFAIAIVMGFGVLASPVPHGLSQPAHSVLAITVFTVLLWVFQVFNNGISSILMIGLMILAKIPVGLALSGFSSPQFWVLLVVLFYGFAMQRTGLAHRISYYILSLFSHTYQGILWGFFFIGLILALGIPPMTVRTAILVPIGWALVESLGLAPRSRGAALIMITVVEMAVAPGCAFLYGSLFGPVVEGVFQAKHLPLSWLSYSRVLAFPTLLLCGLMVVVNQFVLRPEAPLQVSPGFARQKLQALGPIKRTEWITAVVVILSIAYWATGRIHHLPSFLIGMFALAAFGITGIVGDSDIAGGVSWTLLLYLGGIFSLANVIENAKITDWPAGYMVPVVRHLTSNVVLFVVVLALAMLALKFLDPSGFVALPALFLPISDITLAAGIPSLVLVTPLIVASTPFWATYENFWMAMGEGMTSGQAFSAGQRVRLANTYAILALVAFAISVAFWKLTGVL
ncbi:MAG: SLC13 family permease [Candidatus Acidiferrales bacterium]